MHAFDLLITPPQAIDFHVGIGDGDVESEDPMKLGGNSTFGSNTFSGSDGGDWDDRTTFMTGAMANPAGDLGTASRPAAIASPGRTPGSPTS